MTEQEKRAQFFAKTGRIATSERIEYQAFLWGFEYGIESLRQQLAERVREQCFDALDPDKYPNECDKSMVHNCRLAIRAIKELP